MAPNRMLNRRMRLRPSTKTIQAVLAISIILCPMPLIFYMQNTQTIDLQKKYVLDLPTSTHGATGNFSVVDKRNEKKRSPGRDNDGANNENATDITPSDICNLSHNLLVESEHYSSYQLGLNWSNVEHATKKLCLRSASKKKGSENQSTIQDSPSLISNDTSLILTFKVARSGSTFFTDVIIKALNTMKKAANLHWEPYCRVGCYNRKSPIKMEKELSIISSSKCSNNTIDPPICSTPGTHKKCCPVKKCQSPGFHPDAISVVSLNPRFSDSVRWDKILSLSLQRPSSAKVFNLRRTNLVNLAYSKYHHDGCPVISEGLNGYECIPEKTNSTSFSFNCLLQCVQHYGIGDQEFSTSVAFEAAQSTNLSQPHLVLYEDVMRDQLHASMQVFNFIGVKVDEGDNFFNLTTEKQSSYRRTGPDHGTMHDGHICKYHDVNCTEWRQKLKGYPCLLKQLDSKSTTAWSVPIKSTRGKLRLSIDGECHRLENLNKVTHRDRLYEELYL